MCIRDSSCALALALLPPRCPQALNSWRRPWYDSCRSTAVVVPLEVDRFRTVQWRNFFWKVRVPSSRCTYKLGDPSPTPKSGGPAPSPWNYTCGTVPVVRCHFYPLDAVLASTVLCCGHWPCVCLLRFGVLSLINVEHVELFFTSYPLLILLCARRKFKYLPK